MIINKNDLGDDWPFTIDQVDVKNDISLLFIKHKNKKYGINGVSESYGYLPLKDSGIWSDDPEIPGAKKSLTPLFKFIAGQRQ